MIKERPRSRRKAVITQASGGYINIAISITQGLLLLPVYFQFISFEIYGYWATVSSLVAIISIVNFGIGSMASQRISRCYAQVDYQKVGDYFVNSLYVVILISLCFLFFGVILSYWVEDILDVNKGYLSTLVWSYYIAVTTTMISFFSGALRTFSQSILKPLIPVYINIVARVLGIFSVIVMLYMGVGILSIPISLLIAEVVIFSANARYAIIQFGKLNVVSGVNLKLLKEYLHFSPHLLGCTAGEKITRDSHPLIITSLISSEVTTAYILTKKVVDIITQMFDTFNASLLGAFSHLVGESDRERIRRILVKIILVGLLSSFFAFGMYVFLNQMFVDLWIGEGVVLSQNVVTTIGIGYMFYSINRLFRSLLFGFNEFKFSCGSALIEGIFVALLAIILINKIGILGVPLSLSLVAIINSVFLFFRVKKIAYYGGTTV